MERLSPEAKRWVRLKWSKIRASQQKADVAAAAWSELNERLNEKIRQDQMNRRLRGRMGITPLEIVDMKSSNVALKEAISTHSWHAMEASRHTVDVQLYLQLKELGVDVS